MRKLYSWKGVKKWHQALNVDSSFVLAYIGELTDNNIRQSFKVIVLEDGDSLDEMEIIDGYAGGLLRLDFSSLECRDSYYVLHWKYGDCVIICHKRLLPKEWKQYFDDMITYAKSSGCEVD